MTKAEASLRIRPMVAGADDATYVDITNRACAEFPDWTPVAVEEIRFERTMPYYDPHAYSVAELGGRLVGVVRGGLDPLDPERVGWVNARVLPEFRRGRVGTALARAALDGLRRRGARKLRAGVLETNFAGTAFVRSLGFRECRAESWMRRSLERLPSGVGENAAVRIRETTLDDDDLQLTVDLLNEAFKEDWDATPTTVEGRRKRAAELARQGGVIRTWVATLDGRPVGVVQAKISPRDNAALKVERGTLMGLCVLKPFRRQGIAKTLVIEGLRFLKERGMTEAELSVDNSNPAQALGIYLALGFAVVRRWIAYELAEAAST